MVMVMMVVMVVLRFRLPRRVSALQGKLLVFGFSHSFAFQIIPIFCILAPLFCYVTPFPKHIVTPVHGLHKRKNRKETEMIPCLPL